MVLIALAWLIWHNPLCPACEHHLSDAVRAQLACWNNGSYSADVTRVPPLNEGEAVMHDNADFRDLQHSVCTGVKPSASQCLRLPCEQPGRWQTCEFTRSQAHSSVCMPVNNNMCFRQRLFNADSRFDIPSGFAGHCPTTSTQGCGRSMRKTEGGGFTLGHFRLAAQAEQAAEVSE